MTRTAIPPAPATAGFEVHRTPSSLAPWEDAWHDLVAGVPGSSYFVTPDWVLGSWQAMDTAATAEVAVWTGPGGRVEAVVPLVRVRERLHRRLPLPVTCWTLLGSGTDAADHGLFPTLPHRRDEVRAWLGARTGRSSGWFPAMDPEADIGLLSPGTRRIARTTCPRLAIGPSTAVGSPSFRQLMARRRRQLAAAGVSFRWVPPQEMTAEVIDTVIGLHQARQKVKGTTTSFGPGRRAFHLRLQERAAPGRGPAALLAEREGSAVGAVYGFLWQKTFAYYNGGWDEAYARMSLGTVLLHQTIAAMAEAGVETFDFLRGDEGYKYRSFGARDRQDEQWLRSRSPMALLAGTALRLHQRRCG
ncbi:GNAT family N-acetyltransferase [Streptomyces sp. NPDC006482]|uniref:GNAT family N-acetyltransferase n=1 Tax=unclassified Streptomyces TaxID=2593676 RepID=UPI00224D23B4|nr:GNAT family N-acetyltransferase [Streptomyces sp. NBC_00094]MCX5388868.1 GNAT family N-acetyltransferase [Streptomyces sp. NBC_00094]